MVEFRSGVAAAGANPTRIAKLAATALYAHCDPESLPDLSAVDAELHFMPGQQRAVEAIEFGIGIRRQGYNIFVFGPTGSGRHSLVQEKLAQCAAADRLVLHQ